MNESEVDWIANAGKSISKIVAFLKLLRLPSDQNRYVQAILEHTGDPLNKSNSESTESLKPSLLNPSTNLATMSKFNFNFYGNVNLNINETGMLPKEKDAISNKTVLLPAAAEKKERFDEDYSNRIGYVEEFINGFKVPMPTVTNEKEKELYKNFGASVPYIVPYHHYSLVMNKKRRMVMWTASNVDYNEKFRDERTREDFGSGAWRLDPRIPAKYQIQAAEFYDPATLVDKGHIVRRDDNCGRQGKAGELTAWESNTPMLIRFTGQIVHRNMKHLQGYGSVYGSW
jgi:endonuclease G